MKRGNKAAKEYKMKEFYSSAKVADCLSIIGMGNVVEFKFSDVKLAYKRACAKFHPDRCASGLEMMKAINPAYQYLKEVLEGRESITNEKAHDKGQHANYGEVLSEAINAIIHIEGIEINVCGSWVWVTGDTKPHSKEIKAAGFKWANKKVAWYYRPENFKSKNRGKMSLDEIREYHGSQKVATQSRKAITA